MQLFLSTSNPFLVQQGGLPLKSNDCALKGNRPREFEILIAQKVRVTAQPLVELATRNGVRIAISGRVLCIVCNHLLKGSEDLISRQKHLGERRADQFF